DLLRALRGQLEHRALAVSAAHRGSAIEVALLIENQARIGGGPIARLEAKAVEDHLRAGCGQLEHRPLAVRAAADRGAVEVALFIEGQACSGIGPIARLAAKAVQDLLRAGLCQLEHRALVVSAAGEGGAVEVARCIEGQTCNGIGSVARLAAKAVQDLLRTLRGQLEHRAPDVRAAIHRGAVEIALLVHDQASLGISSVAIRASKAVEHSLRPSGSQLKYRAPAVRAAAERSAVEVPRFIKDQASTGIVSIARLATKAV